MAGGGVAPLLYRSLLRSARRIEALSVASLHAPLIRAELRRACAIDVPHLRLSQAVREHFRDTNTFGSSSSFSSFSPSSPSSSPSSSSSSSPPLSPSPSSPSPSSSSSPSPSFPSSLPSSSSSLSLSSSSLPTSSSGKEGKAVAHALDTGFRALRCSADILAWLPYASRLHALAAEGAHVEAGALVIAEAIEELVPRAELPQLPPWEDSETFAVSLGSHFDSHVQTLAEAARPAAGKVAGGDRLKTIAAINAALFSERGLRGEMSAANVVAGSSVNRVLVTGHGLPITLCTIYQAVARKLGLQLEQTGFPRRVLLRLDGHTDEPAGAAESAGGARPKGVPVRVVPIELEGTWRAEYGIHGTEVVEVRLVSGRLEARKLTGDPHVPAGELTWIAQVSDAEGDAAVGKSTAPISLPLVCDASVQVAEEGFVNARMADCQLELISADAMMLRVDGGPMIFTRAPDDGLWFVDPFDGGRLLPPEAAAGMLTTMGVPETAHDKCTAPVHSACVWARMLRNLRAHHRNTSGSDVTARVWEYMSHGLVELYSNEAIAARGTAGGADGETSTT